MTKAEQVEQMTAPIKARRATHDRRTEHVAAELEAARATGNTERIEALAGEQALLTGEEAKLNAEEALIARTVAALKP